MANCQSNYQLAQTQAFHKLVHILWTQDGVHVKVNARTLVWSAYKLRASDTMRGCIPLSGIAAARTSSQFDDRPESYGTR